MRLINFWQSILFTQFLILGCTTLTKDETLTTTIPFDRPISDLYLNSDSNGNSHLSISKLHLDLSKPFNIAFRNFQHGSFDVIEDSVLVYHSNKKNSEWASDSGFIQVFQGGKNKDGFVKISNPYRKEKPVISWPVMSLIGTPLPDMPTTIVDFFDSRAFSNLIGMEENGSEIDSIWGFVYSAAIKADKKSINYLAGGGLANFLNFGTDHIYYRIKRSNGLYFRGMIPILIGDPSQPLAQNDEIILPTGSGFISLSSLLANDVGTNPASPRQPIVIRLEPLTYTLPLKKNIQFGIIKDSLENGQPAFYYKRMATGNAADTTFVFLEEGPEKRITRGRLIIK